MPEIREFTLPDLGEGLEDGEIVDWFVAVGDHIALNQAVVTVESAKAVVELPSPFEGRVTDICAATGQTLNVGAPLMRVAVGEDGSAPESDPKPLVGYGAAAAATAGRRRRRATAHRDGPAAAPEPAAAPDAVRARALPPVRKLARDHGIDLRSLAPGSGPDGRVLRQDVEAALTRPSGTATPPSPAAAAATSAAAAPEAMPRPGFRGRYPGEVEQVKGIRKRIITKMEESRRTIPDAGCARDTDMTVLWALRSLLTQDAVAEGHEVRITPLALICRATVLALRRFPTLNSRYDAEAGQIRLLEQINLGMAVDTDSGLMVANIKNAERLSVLELAEETARLAARCRHREATPDDLTGGTFTVNNYGYFGNDDGSPIINAPESGILGIGAIRERPWVVDGQLTVRRVARLQLVFDHRVCDGGEAGRFIDHLARLCEEPSRLLLHG